MSHNYEKPFILDEFARQKWDVLAGFIAQSDLIPKWKRLLIDEFLYQTLTCDVAGLAVKMRYAEHIHDWTFHKFRQKLAFGDQQLPDLPIYKTIMWDLQFFAQALDNLYSSPWK